MEGGKPMIDHPKLLKCRELMKEEGLAATIAVSPENTLYFSECYLLTQTDLRLRLAMAVMPLDSDPAMIACKIESSSVEAETWIQDKRYYVEFQLSPIELLAQILEEKGLAGKRIGIETDYLMASYYVELIKRMPTTEFVLCTRLFEKVRMVKDEKEIALLANASRKTIKAFEAACMMTCPGDTEAMLAKRTVDNLLTLGADKLDFISLCSGPRTIEVHGMAGNDPLKDGEVLRVDFGGQYSHYLTDLARTAVIGKPNPKYVDIFERLAQVYVDTYPMLRPGVAACEVWQTAKENYAKQNLPFIMTLVGHGIGIGPHEMPVLSLREKQELLPGMLICYELSVHEEKRRMHHEELVLISENGPVLLSAPELNPHLLRIE